MQPHKGILKCSILHVYPAPPELKCVFEEENLGAIWNQIFRQS